MSKSGLAVVSDEFLDQRLLEQKVEAIDRQLPNVLIVTFVVTSSLALYFYDQKLGHDWKLLVWWCAMQCVALLRLSYLVWMRRANRDRLNPQIAVNVFGAGSVAVGVLWASFSVLYFGDASQAQRLVICLVMSTIAAGSVSVLATMPWVNRVFMGLLLGPLVIMFALSGEINDLAVAGLGVVLFIALTRFSKVLAQNQLTAFWVTQNQKSPTSATFAHRDDLVKVKNELEERVKKQIQELEKEIELKELYSQELDKIAHRDLLTGLLNRNGFDFELGRLIVTTNNPKFEVGLIAIEIMHFDMLELQSVLISDQVLLTLTDRLKRFLPDICLVAYWGDGEFYVAFVKPYEANHWNRYAGLVRNVLQQPIATELGILCLDVLVGVTSYPVSASNKELMLYQCAAAKHSLRKLGVGGIKVFDPLVDASLKTRHQIQEALSLAIQGNELALTYQPIKPTNSKQPYKFEALLCWQDEELGVVPPSSFIPIAEESGLILPLGRWVLRSACEAMVGFDKKCVVCVNVSIHQILGGDLVRDIESALSLSGLPGERLEIEIPESIFSQDLTYISSVLESVRDMGVGVVIDNFGTGYSSLSCLRRLPVETIKIDRSFIGVIDQEARKLLFSIITMGRGLGFQITAEGIETEQQQDLLMALGVDYLQGDLFSKPAPLHSACLWMEAQEIEG